ncbi:cyclase family protein [Lysobacter auxotrophicus]|uniref:Cyclase family protein n=1 Tax=Lysobacter auxotrophicus TaxID=2992573 RepID=A0ABM8DFM2_9GAMM|nr:cyclase family protein [Lysobacter auxotrophicus]BDU17406.1 cyclase family protein [Lysobacter auxotrophicus]
MTQKRVVFDFDLQFTNGGGIQGQDFRLDIEGDDIDDAALVDYIVRDLRLLMVGPARILNKKIIVEAHKRKTRDASDERRLYIELSHVIEDGLVTYPGLPAARICDYLSRERSREVYEAGTEFQIGRIDMVANTGTYLDCPSHRYEHGHDLSQIEPEAFCDLDAIVIRADHRDVRAIDASWFRDRELRGRAVLVHTGWDAYWREASYAVEHPFLTQDAAEYLRDCGVKLVGIDSMNIDDTSGKSRPVHSVLLGADILIVEHLCNLAALPDEGFEFSAMPPKVRGMGTFPVRAMGKLRG